MIIGRDNIKNKNTKPAMKPIASLKLENITSILVASSKLKRLQMNSSIKPSKIKRTTILWNEFLFLCFLKHNKSRSLQGANSLAN